MSPYSGDIFHEVWLFVVLLRVDHFMLIFTADAHCTGVVQSAVQSGRVECGCILCGKSTVMTYRSQASL